MHTSHCSFSSKISGIPDCTGWSSILAGLYPFPAVSPKTLRIDPVSCYVSTSHLSYAQQYCAIVVTQWRIETLYSKQQNWNLMTNSILLIFMIYRFNGKKKNTLKKTSTFLAVENVNCPFGNETESCIGDKQWRSHCRGIIRVSQSCSICNGCLGVTIQPINHRR